jgi:2-phospho-L-lactate/phosphoenolpyruvate guanylyltransferase
MNAVLIPVKDLRRAKQRLAPLLSSADRQGLAHAMFEDVCAAAAAARGIERVFLVSSYGPALEKARGLGWEMIRETAQDSESASVDFASRLCATRGVESLLRLPIDVPLVEAEDIELLFTQLSAAPCAVICPSRSGTGTNALLRRPPGLFASHFGPGSFARHLREAARVGVRCTIVTNARLGMDVDDGEDLQVLLSCIRPQTATGRWLSHAGFAVSNGQ